MFGPPNQEGPPGPIPCAWSIEGEAILSGYYTVYVSAFDEQSFTNPRAGVSGLTLQIYDNWGANYAVPITTSSEQQSLVFHIPFTSSLIAALNQSGSDTGFSTHLNFYASGFNGIDHFNQLVVVNVVGWTISGTAITAAQDVHTADWYAIDWQGPYSLPSGSFSDLAPGRYVTNPVQSQSWTIPTIPSGTGIMYMVTATATNINVFSTTPTVATTIGPIDSRWSGVTFLSTGWTTSIPNDSGSWLVCFRPTPNTWTPFNSSASGTVLLYEHDLRRYSGSAPDTPISISWAEEQLWLGYQGALLSGPPGTGGGPVTPPPNPPVPPLPNSSSSSSSGSNSVSSGSSGIACCSQIVVGDPNTYFPYPPQFGDNQILPLEEWRRIPGTPS